MRSLQSRVRYLCAILFAAVVCGCRAQPSAIPNVVADQNAPEIPNITLGPGFLVGTDQLAFRIYNGSQQNWGCLDGVYVGGDPRPGERGILASLPDGQGATPMWQLTATACNDSFPASQLVLQSCTAVCAKKYLVSLEAEQATATNLQTTTATLRWESCETPFLGRSASKASTLDIDVSVTIVGGVSTWSATVGKANAEGVCIQVNGVVVRIPC